jgi:hypothetical protein
MNPEETNTTPAPVAKKAAPKFRITRDQIKLEHDIPPPEAAIPNLTGRATYPVANLEEGTSFSFPAPPRHRLSMLKSANSAIGSHVKNHPNKQFIARIIEEEGVVRVWRIADKNSGNHRQNPAPAQNTAAPRENNPQIETPNPGIHLVDEEAAPPAGAVPITRHEASFPGEDA